MISDIEMNRIAIQLRYRNHIPESGPVDIFSQLSIIDNMTVIFRPFSNQVSGMCSKKGNNYFIIINSMSSYGRQRFTAAHEMYHLFYEKDSTFVCSLNVNDNSSESEKNADNFASFYLAPYDTFMDYVERIGCKKNEAVNFYQTIKIGQYFQMSQKAVEVRLRKLGFAFAFKQDQYKVSKTACEIGYPVDLYLPSKSEFFTYGKYIRDAEKVFEINAVSSQKYESYLMDAYRPDIVYGMSSEMADLYD